MKQIPGNVKIIPTVKSVDPPEIVTYLQEMLEQARSGEITGLLAVTMDDDGQASYTCAGIDDAFKVIGCMRYAEHMLLNEFLVEVE